jgi:hypothetical protein
MLNKTMSYKTPQGSIEEQAHLFVSYMHYSTRVVGGKEVGNLSYNLAIYATQALYIAGEAHSDLLSFNFEPSGAFGYEKQIEDHVLANPAFESAVVYS